MKIITILGARPQFIKAAMLSKEIAKDNVIQEVIVHTGQHFDANMSDIFFNEMGIPKPDYYLDINSMGHGAMTGRMLEEIEKVLIQEKPDMVIVYGDTNSTLAGALAAVKLRIPVAHIEAGIRSGYYLPEEVNRVLTDQMANLLFAPSQRGVEALLVSGIAKDSIENVGDIMFDAVKHYQEQLVDLSHIILKNEQKPYILLTLHREENIDHDDKFKVIINELLQISKMYNIVWPVHPRAKNKLKALHLWNEVLENIILIEPQSYITMLNLIKNSVGVITDSGGLQKEAYYVGRPFIIVKEKTEWPELLKTGYAKLISEKYVSTLASEVRMFFSQEFTSDLLQPYGNGTSASQILCTIKSYLFKRS